MNKVFLSGNLTRDVEVRYTQTGKAVARMGIAVNRLFSKEKAVDFFNLIAWEKTAEFCGKYLAKGSRVLVEGRLQTSSYENRDGVKVNAVDVLIDNIEFAGAKRQDSGDSGDSYGRRDRDDYSAKRDNDYSGDSYGRRDRDDYSSNREPAPPKRNDTYKDEFIGEKIDPEDSPF